MFWGFREKAVVYLGSRVWILWNWNCVTLLWNLKHWLCVFFISFFIYFYSNHKLGYASISFDWVSTVRGNDGFGENWGNVNHFDVVLHYPKNSSVFVV